MNDNSAVFLFLQQAMGALYKNKKARAYILDQISGRNIEDVPYEEIQRIIEEAIEIAQGKRK